MRQVGRLLSRYRDDGGGGLIHKGRGRASNHRVNEGVREYALELVRAQYRDFGPTLAIEALYERHGIKVGRETLRTWMLEAGLWASRKQRKTFHQPRLRRESYGELVQQRFVYRLHQDLSAVEAAVSEAWSNGPVEGHVGRLKTIKRQMYGRAPFELLRARVLPFTTLSHVHHK